MVGRYLQYSDILECRLGLCLGELMGRLVDECDVCWVDRLDDAQGTEAGASSYITHLMEDNRQDTYWFV